MATGDKLVNLDVLKNTVHKEVVDLKSAVDDVTEETANMFWFTNTTARTLGEHLDIEFLNNSTIKLDGSADANYYLVIRGGTTLTDATLPADTYIYNIVLKSGTGTVNKLRKDSGSTTLNMNEALTFSNDVAVLFSIRKDQEFEDAVFQVMLNKGSTLLPYVDHELVAIDKTARSAIENKPSYIPNQILILFGDSWSAPVEGATKWCDYLAQDLHLAIRNYASSGAGYKNGTTSYYGKRINDKILGVNANYSGLIAIFGSGNDCQYMAESAGEETDIYDPTGGTGDTVAGRINYAFAMLKDKAPYAKVLIIGPCPWQIYPPTSANNSMIQYCALLKSLSEKAGFAYVDMYYKSDLRPWDDTQANFWSEQSPENRVHPSAAGHYFLYPQIRDAIKNMLPGVSPAT